MLSEFYRDIRYVLIMSFPQLPFSLLSDPVNMSLLPTHELEKYLFMSTTESSKWYMNTGHLLEHRNLQRGCAIRKNASSSPGTSPVTCR